MSVSFLLLVSTVGAIKQKPAANEQREPVVFAEVIPHLCKEVLDQLVESRYLEKPVQSNLSQPRAQCWPPGCWQLC